MADDSIAGYEPCREFQRIECARHIIQICAACIALPGSGADPELRARLAPQWEAPVKH